MKKEIYICDRCFEETRYYDEFSSTGELKKFDLCDRCVLELKAFLKK